MSYLLSRLFKQSTFQQVALRVVQMLDGRTPKSECAVLLEKWSYFVLFSFVLFKNKGQERYQQESQNKKRI